MIPLLALCLASSPEVTATDAPAVASTDVAAEEPTAREQAEALHREGHYAEAAEAYARAYQETGLPELLYSRAQVERLAGDCEAAMESYEDFLIHTGDEAPANASESFRQVWPRMRINARKQIDACRETLEQAEAEAAAEAPAPTPAPAPTIEPPTPVEPAPTPVDDGPPRWKRDALGWSLVGSGLAVAVAGGTLWGVAVAQDGNADGAPSHGEFLAEIDRAATMQQVGFGLLAGGAAILVGGVIRLAVVARRGHRPGARERRAARWPIPVGGVLSSHRRGR